MKAIELLARARYSDVDICAELRINPITLQRWQQKPLFMHAVIMRSRKLLKQNLPEVYGKLTEKSIEGSSRHIKILLDHMEKLEEAKAGQTSITFTWRKPNE